MDDAVNGTDIVDLLKAVRLQKARRLCRTVAAPAVQEVRLIGVKGGDGTLHLAAEPINACRARPSAPRALTWGATVDDNAVRLVELLLEFRRTQIC